jgi:DNA-binding transcriptional LysR family regulator
MHINNIGLRQLRYFVAVAEELHFGRAAKRLHISHPPLSQQIMALEQELGTRLLERTNRRVALTEAGKYLHHAAQKLLQDMNHAAEHVRMVAQGAVGRIRIGVHFSVPLHPYVGLLMQRFRASNPQVRLEIMLHDKNDQSQLGDIENSVLDLGLLWVNRDHHGDVRRFDLVFNPLRAYLPEGHPLAAQEVLTVDDLQGERLIGPPRGVGSQLYEAMTAFFGSTGYAQNILYEAGQMPIIMNMVAAGQGIALLPDFLQRLYIMGTVTRPLAVTTPNRPGMMLNLVARHNPEDAAQEQFIHMAVAVAALYQNTPHDGMGHMVTP